MPTQNHLTLFGEFPAVSTEQWMAVVEKDLKGADFEKRLVSKTEEGIPVRPFYRSEDLPVAAQAKPGQAPFLRGYRTDGNHWAVRERILVQDPKEANSQALNALNRGAEQLEFLFLGDADARAVSESVQGIVVDIAPTFVQAAPSVALPAGVRRVCDPLTEGAARNDLGVWRDRVAAALKAGNGLTVNAGAFQEAGATAAQELALALAVLADQLDAATEAGVSAEEALKQIEVRTSVGSNYFLEIAKIRAWRVLCHSVCKAFGVPQIRPSLHATTTRATQTLYDPNVNMLRATTQAMSAAIAGVDSITVLPYDGATRLPDDFSLRIARNAQLLLREEAYLEKVADPLGGSYYVERLTAELADRAWALFQKIEADGGFAAAWQNGWPAEAIAEVRVARQKAIGSRRQPIVGTSNYPNPKDVAPSAILEPDNRGVPLGLFRHAASFESLRVRIDKLVAEGGSRPLVLLVQMGDVKMRKARATFCAGFYGSGGYAVEEVVAKSAEEAAAFARERQAKLVVLCSSDPEYAELVGPVAKALGGMSKLVVAGSPPDAEQLKQSGAQDFVHIRLDVVETLAKLHAELNIPEVTR